MASIVIGFLLVSILLTCYQYNKRKRKIAQKLEKMKKNSDLIKSQKRWK